MKILFDCSVVLENRKTFLFYIGFGILCFSNVVSDIAYVEPVKIAWESIRDVLGMAAICCFSLKFVFQVRELRNRVLSVLALILGIIIRVISGDSTFFFLCLMVLCVDDVRVSVLAKILMCSITTGFIVCLISNALSLTVCNDIYDTRSILGYRRALGFSHPNTLGKILVAYSGASVIAYGSRRSAAGVVILLLTLATALFVADSRTATVGIAGMTTIFLIGHSNRFHRFNLKKIALVFLFGGLILTLTTMVFYNESSEFDTIVNTVLSYRPEFWHRFYEYYGVGLFGNALLSGTVLNIYGSDAQLDGAYSTALIQYGLLATLIIGYFVVILFLKTKQGRNNELPLSVLIVYLIIGLMENYALSPIYNFVLVGAGCYLNNNQSGQFFEIGSREAQRTSGSSREAR